MTDMKAREQPTVSDASTSRDRRAMTIVAVVVVALLLGGLGGWMLWGSESDLDAIVIGGGELTDRQVEMLNMLDEYTDALLANDGAAVVEMFAPEGTMTSTWSEVAYRADDGTLEQFVDTFPWVDTLEKPVMVHQSTLRLVHEYQGSSYADAVEFTFGGDLKIFNHRMFR